MRHPLTCSVAIIATMAIFSSCDTTESSDPPVVPMVAGIEQFRNNVGDHWTYVVYDSIRRSTDTVVVEVTRAPHPAEPPFRNAWVYTGTNHQDTVYVVTEGKRVAIYESPVAAEPMQVILFPLQDGATWGSGPDVSVVHAEPGFQSVAGHGAFRIERRVVGANYTLHLTLWLVPDGGIAKIERREFNLGPAAREEWMLVALKLD